MRPAHLIDSNVSGADRQELFARKFNGARVAESPVPMVRPRFTSRNLRGQRTELRTEVRPGIRKSRRRRKKSRANRDIEPGRILESRKKFEQDS